MWMLRYLHRCGSFTWLLRCFGTRAVHVLDDVGVRFGGSEHHRIETSSSHIRPRPFGAGTPGPSVYGKRSASAHRAHDAIGVRRSAFFGSPTARLHRDSANGALRGAERRVSSEQETRTSSEARTPRSTGSAHLASWDGVAARFGAPRIVSSGWTPRTALFGVLRARPNGTGNQDLFGGPGAPPRNGLGPSLGEPVPRPSGQGHRNPG
jgi:hypothetical protein